MAGWMTDMIETQNIEWKAFWRDEYLKWICGFANAQGGVLEIGKDNQGEVVGVTGAARLLEELPNKINSTSTIRRESYRESYLYQ